MDTGHATEIIGMLHNLGCNHLTMSLQLRIHQWDFLWEKIVILIPDSAKDEVLSSMLLEIDYCLSSVRMFEKSRKALILFSSFVE